MPTRSARKERRRPKAGPSGGRLARRLTCSRHAEAFCAVTDPANACSSTRHSGPSGEVRGCAPTSRTTSSCFSARPQASGSHCAQGKLKVSPIFLLADATRACWEKAASPACIDLLSPPDCLHSVGVVVQRLHSTCLLAEEAATVVALAKRGLPKKTGSPASPRRVRARVRAHLHKSREKADDASSLPTSGQPSLARPFTRPTSSLPRILSPSPLPDIHSLTSHSLIWNLHSRSCTWPQHPDHSWHSHLINTTAADLTTA